ncbi:DUF5327 family protein [Staphylococcus sp. EZ-P03]|uniref:DUF5327 family protein n=1 Tax=Staphylococcus sp. EZ-P03 TaxID=2282739 RepID=UPI000DF8451C|nr:DUF5327 family protein [Staphylococcus sp. EZ-P03]
MNKEKLIALIERELVQADEAHSEAEFNKHMYAIHTLTSLYTDAEPSDTSKVYAKQSAPYQQPAAHTSVQKQSPSTSGVSAEEIKAMGGKVASNSETPNSSTPPGASNKMVTDDQLGNGDSIFDF